MISATALVALALAGATPTTPAQPATAGTSEITYQFRVLEMKGLAWRTEFHHRLQPVARQGTATVWTVDSATAGALTTAAEKVVQAPKVTTFSRARATVFDRTDRHHVSEIRRVSDGEPFRGTRVAFQPKVDSAGEGWRADIAGRVLDQGVLAEVSVEATEVIAIHTVAAPDGVHEKGSDCCLEAEKPSDAPLVDGAVKAAQAVGILAATPCKSSGVRAQYQVPEVVEGKAAGEWLIPTDGCLAIGLGVHTSADADGKAVASERVVLVSASAVAARPSAAVYDPAAPALPKVVHGTRAMTTPAMPSRSLPQGFSPDGAPADLPPLPDDQFRPASHESHLPTPQAPAGTLNVYNSAGRLGVDFDFTLGAPKRDADAVRVNLDPAKLARLETQTFRIPLSARLVLEFAARVVPTSTEGGDCQGEAAECPAK